MLSSCELRITTRQAGDVERVLFVGVGWFGAYIYRYVRPLLGAGWFLGRGRGRG